MGSCKRVRLSVLCLTVAALFAATPAFADRGTATLTASGDEPDASGKMTLTNGWAVYWDDYWGDYFKAPVIKYTLTCTGLTPGATYWSYNLTADEDGKLVVKGYYWDDSGWRPSVIQVWRLVDASSHTWVEVLYGEVVWSGKP